MADYNTPSYGSRPIAGSDAQAIDQGLRAYMINVYQYMALAVGLTGAVAYFVAATPAIYNPIFNSGLVWVVMLAPIGLVMWLSWGINSLSASTAQMVYWFYAALNGVSLAVIFMAYPIGDIGRVFLISAATFGALSLYGYTTPRSLSGWGSFLFMGLIGIMIASIVNIFMQSSAMDFAISVIGVLVFAGLTAYDTQQIKEIYLGADDSETMGKKAIMGALRLYLDFINLFLMLLRLLSNRD
jgi:hypothetical protein